MNRVGRRLTLSLCILFTLATLALLHTLPARAEASVFHDNFKLPLEETLFSACAGEDIRFTGTVHVETHVVEDAHGGVHFQSTVNDQNVRGIGLTSGTKYRRVGATVDRFNTTASGFPFETTFTESCKFIGPGTANNTLLLTTFHITVNAKGEITAEIDRVKVECK